MSATLRGRLPNWSMSRDAEGHRTYKVRHLVECSTTADGPNVVFNCAGLPLAGSVWAFGNDLDFWAFCKPELKVERHRSIPEQRPGRFWIVENTFSTKLDSKRCQDEEIEDPLLEPQKVSGSFVKYLEVARYDKEGDPIETSAREPIKEEFDANRPTVRIGQNVASLGLSSFSEMVDTVNNAALWGLAKRCVKLSNVSWERKIMGTCDYYYTRTFHFDIRYNTFDREVDDFGQLAVGRRKKDNSWEVPSGWTNASREHINVYHDKHGNPSRTWLNSSGHPCDPDSVNKITIQKYTESNFLSLGIPTSF